MVMDKKFDAKTAEPRIYAAWEAANAFAAGANASRDETFCILLPPPNVTGFLHAGHAFNHTLMDILTRWKRMQGYDVLWQPGLDHAGIATQLVVERELAKEGKKRTDFTRDAFIERVQQWKDHSGGTIVEQDKRLGASMDWSREAFTMDPAFHDAVIRVFVDMYEKGLIYRGKRLVNWDPHFETAISDLEVENTEVAGHMWHFKYPLANGASYEYVEKDADGVVTLRETRDYIAIATTRPETMLGDGAVAVHPSDERYASIIGKLCEIPVGPKEHRRLVPIITDDYPDPDFGSGAVKITGAHDFNDYAVAQRNRIPLYVLMDTKGAMRSDGLSYTESADRAGELSRAWAAMFSNTGTASPDHPVPDVSGVNLVPEEYRGLDRFEARDKIVAEIIAEGLAVMVRAEAEDTVIVGLDPAISAGGDGMTPATGGNADAATEGDPAETWVPFIEDKPLMQPFGDRSKVVIEPMLTDQWFVDTDKIVGPALDAVRSGEVRIIPESGEKVYFHWLENIEPWCISRQLWWGHQIPVWYGFDLSAPEFRDDEGDGALDLVEMLRLFGDDLVQGTVMQCGPEFEGVVDAFHGELADTPLPLSAARIVEVSDRAEALHLLASSLADYTASQDPTHLVYPVWRDPDVLDTWFSSGLWPIGTLGWPGDEWAKMRRYHPTSVLITGSDILFFWVARMMMMQYAVVDEKPFHTVYLHGLVRDAKGRKMSKTTGNVVDPLDIVDEFGADALRFTNAAMASLGGALKLDTDRIKGYRNFTTKLWNAARFAEMNDAVGSDGQIPQATAPVNRWIIGETGRVRAEVDAALDAYRFNEAANALYVFVWGKVCDWYVEFSKPLFDTDKADETRKTMAWVIDQCLILLHPIMPFVTEDLWGTLGTRPKLLVHADWPTYGAELTDAEADTEMLWAIQVIEATRSARAQMHVPAGAYVPMLTTGLEPQAQGAWDANKTLIKRLARIESLDSVADFPKGCVTIPVTGGTLGMPLAGLIDVAAEKARVEKALLKLGKEIKGLSGRVNNPNFATSAPEEVVAEARANLSARQEDEAALNAALARLQELD